MERKNIGQKEDKPYYYYIYSLFILFIYYYFYIITFGFHALLHHCITSSKGGLYGMCGVCKEQTEESKEQVKRERMRTC